MTGSTASVAGSTRDTPELCQTWRRSTLKGVPLPRRLQSADEEVLIDAHPHWVFFFGPAAATVSAAVVSLAVIMVWPSAPIVLAWLLTVLVLVPAGWLLLRLLRWIGTSLVVTTERIVMRRGPGKRRMTEVRMRRVHTVHLRRSLLERLVGCGSLIVGLREGGAWALPDVAHPAAVQDTINRHVGLLSSPAPTSLREGAVHRGVNQRGASAVAAASPQKGPAGDAKVSRSGGSIPEQIRELAELCRLGILSRSEFEAKKRELLSRL